MFMTRVLRLGFTFAKPWGDSAPYDCIIERDGRMLRIQVKSVFEPRNYAYVFHTGGDRTCYTTYDFTRIDFLACFVVPLQLWYIVPVSAIKPNQELLFTYPLDHLIQRDKQGHRRRTRRGPSYEQFCEAWNLLG